MNYFIGEYKNNKKNGNGYHHFINGLIYKGLYKDDKKVDGKIIDPKDMRDVYVGDWGNDNYNGKGTLLRSNGAKYIGEF